MNEKLIWDFLIEKTKNSYGTAALMGNLMAESSLNPKCVTGNKNANYVQDADRGAIDFVHDGAAFGLVQWCYWSRKEGLKNYAVSKNKSVGDIDIQLEYLWIELQSYKTAFNAVMEATSIREASDVVMLKYEKPANTSEAAKKRRADYGKMFFDQFNTKMVTAKENVNIRAGNDTKYAKIGTLKKDNSLEWVATAENGWHAVKMKDRVGWVSGEFTR